MADTTDIKALRERLVGLNRTYALISSPATMEQANTSAHMFVKAGGINRIIEALDRLEAERQRTAGSEEELHKALHREKATERKLLAALEELTALKGEQVPVSAEFFADGKWWPFSNAEHKANTIAAGYPVRELFTAAPKPVVDDSMALAFHHALNDGGIGHSDLDEIKVGLRAALGVYDGIVVNGGEPTTITCWSCKKSMTLAQHSSNDGLCPHCNVEIDLEE